MTKPGGWQRLLTLFCLIFPACWLYLPDIALIIYNPGLGLSLKSLGLLLTVFCTIPILLILSKNLLQFWCWNLVFAFFSGCYLGYILYYHDIPYDGMWFALWNASPDVVTGTIKYFYGYCALGITGFLLYCACLMHPLQKKIILSKKFRYNFLFSGLALVAVWFYLTNFFSQKIPVQRVADETTILQNYPYGMLLMLGKTGVAFSQNQRITLKPIARSQVPAGREIYVFVIGEAARQNDWLAISRQMHSSLLTDPNIQRFDHAVSQANLTSPALELMLTGAATFATAFKQPLWFDIAHAAGCTTGWITNAREPFNLPERNDFYDLNIDRFAWVGLSAVVYDDVLLPEIQRSITQGPEKLCLIVHFKGSHFDYRSRYRADLAKYPVARADYDNFAAPGHLLAFQNAYYNSMIQTNVILQKMIGMLKNEKGTVFLLYTSDHAESFNPARHLFFHGNLQPEKAELEVPLFIWANSEYQQQYPAKWHALAENQKRLLSTSQVLPTLMDAMAIRDIPVTLAPSLLQSYAKDVDPQVLLPQMALVRYQGLPG
jgi:glucan phosphoethanolaminetransferase (alkaline phosphatase superfamily)